MNAIPRLHLVASPWVAELLTHLWQSTVVALAILLLLVLGRRLSARTRRTLGWIALAKFALPVAWLGTLFRRSDTAAQAGLMSDPSGSLAGITSTAWVAAAAPVSAWVPPAGLWPLLGGGWAAVAVALIAHWAVRGVRARRALMALARPVEDSVVREVAAAAERAGLRTAPRCVEVERDHGPGALGIVSPVLILPRGLMDGLSPAERAAILIHECVHVRRRDNLWSAVRAVFVGLLWFDPIAWLLNRAIGIETEKSCDERVLEITGDADNYASGIVASVRHTLGLVGLGYAAATTPPVVARLKNILAYPARPDNRFARWAVVALALALVALGGRAGSIAATAPVVTNDGPNAAVRVAQATPAPIAEAPAQTAPAKPADKIGTIALNFVGPSSVTAEAVFAVMQLRKGGDFNEASLDRDIRAIYGLGAFKSVEVKHVPVGSSTFNLLFELTAKPAVGSLSRPATDPTRANVGAGTLVLGPTAGGNTGTVTSQPATAGTLTLSGVGANASTGVTFEVPARPTFPKPSTAPVATPAGDEELRVAQAQLAAESAELRRMREARAEVVARQRLQQEQEAQSAAFAREQRAVAVPEGLLDASAVEAAKQKKEAAEARLVLLRAEREAALARLREAKGVTFDEPVFEPKDLDRAPAAQFQARPQYPFEMRRAGIGGKVVVDFIVDTEGRVQLAHAIRSSRVEFEAAAVQAVSRWKFHPGQKNGKSVPTHLQMPIVFRLEKN